MRNLSDSVARAGLSVFGRGASRPGILRLLAALSLGALALVAPHGPALAAPEEEAAAEGAAPVQPAAPTRLIGNVGVRYVTKGQTLLDIARDNRLGILEVMAANPDKDPWVPGQGSLIILPTHRILPDAPEKGIAINLAERRLYYFDDPSGEVLSLPIGIGREGFTTPLGSTKIVRKKANPIWYPTAATRADSPELPQAVAAGPDNPLGDYALYLGWPTYAIHGTNKPWGVGRQVSRGCIRLYPEDIEFLFGEAAVGTPVTVVNQPVKFAWQNDRLFMEIHPSRDQLDALEQNGHFEPERLPGLLEMAEAALRDRPQSAGEDGVQDEGEEAADGEKEDVLADARPPVRLDLAALALAERERRGVPTIVSLP